MSKLLQQAAAARKRSVGLTAADSDAPTGSNKRARIGSKGGSDLGAVTAVSKKGKASADADSKVVYLGHIPHGFYEKEMRAFFSQFGDVTRLKLFRSKKTFNSKGYAFIEFSTANTARIVSEAIDGYMLKERQLVAHVVPTSKHHKKMFATMRRPAHLKIDRTKTASGGDATTTTGPASGEDQDSDEEPVLGEAEMEKLADKYRRSVRNKQKKLDALGIDFKIN